MSHERAVPLELPHPESYATAARAREHVVAHREASVGGATVAYEVFRPSTEVSEPGMYDEHGVVFISSELVDQEPTFADLVAFHELAEIRQKRAGAWHGEAHLRAYVEELLTARAALPSAELERYLAWRIGMYPSWKGLNVARRVSDLRAALNIDGPDQAERLYAYIARHGL